MKIKKFFPRPIKGLSAVVTTLIIILLVLVAVGLIWVVVRGMLDETGTQVTSKTECIGAQVNIRSMTCTSTTACSVVVERLSGGSDKVNSVKVTVSDTNGNSLTGVDDDEAFGILDVETIPVTGGTLTSGSQVLSVLAAPMAGTTVCDTIDPETFTVNVPA